MRRPPACEAQRRAAPCGTSCARHRRAQSHPSCLPLGVRCPYRAALLARGAYSIGKRDVKHTTRFITRATKVALLLVSVADRIRS